MNTDKICLVEFHRPNFKIQTFSEIISSLLSSFSRMGVDVSYKQNQTDADATNIIFGSHRLFQSYKTVETYLPHISNSIFFNLEPLLIESSNASHLNYVNLLKKSKVIDYSDNNCSLLRELGNNSCHRFRFGYISLTPASAHFPSRNNNFIFYGVPSERRKRIIESLLKNNLPLRAVSGYWGFERDYEIATAKAVLNISKSNDSILELYRLWHSLCLGTPVVTEPGVDSVLVSEWKNYVAIIDSLDDFSIDNLKSIPPARLYKEQTSFYDETVRLKDWISLVNLPSH
jgi:hypothetical protein